MGGGGGGYRRKLGHVRPDVYVEMARLIVSASVVGLVGKSRASYSSCATIVYRTMYRQRRWVITGCPKSFYTPIFFQITGH